MIETVELAKRYRDSVALSDLSLTVRRAEVFGFLGPNGAGKTTAVKLLLGLARATGGFGEVLGAPLGDRETRRRIGYLPELFRYQDWLDAYEVLAFHARLIAIPRATRRSEIERVLAIVDLASRARDRVGTYSKGMQQRLGLAVALLGSPALVFLDEPTSALDPLGRHDVRLLIEQLRENGTTVFLNSHLLTEVERICDRIAIVERGQIIASGSVAELLGEDELVRLQLACVDSAARDVLARAGALREHGAQNASDPSWYRVPALQDIPQLVRNLVAEGVAIYAVEPQRATLEQRFLELLTPEHSAVRNRITDPS